MIKNLKSKIVSAPLAGYSNYAYRKIMKEAGVGLVFSEMVSAKGLVYDNQKTVDYLKTFEDERPIAIQIFGSDKEDLMYATKLICSMNICDVIDINMGCPVKKVLKQNAGAYLLQDPSKVYELVSSVVSVSSLPVSVKIRAGWDNSLINCCEVSRQIEKAKASFITIHGRTKSSMYGGKVNLDYIKMVKDSVSIPVIGNGDITSIEEAIEMFEYTKCDAIMIGRGSLGNPWLVRDLVNYFNSEAIKEKPTLTERVLMIIKHYEELKKIKPTAIQEIKSIALWYLKGVPNMKNIKNEIIKIGDEVSFYNILQKLL